MIQTPDSGFRTKLKDWTEMQRLIKFNLQDARDIRDLALDGFIVLGEDAKGAIPELLILMRRTNRSNGRWEIIWAIGRIGPSAQAAVPALLAIASDAKDPEKLDAIRSLGFIHSQADAVVPFLTSCLLDPAPRTRAFAASALAQFEGAAQSSVPVLISLLSQGSRDVCESATNALKRIDPVAAAAAGVK